MFAFTLVFFSSAYDMPADASVSVNGDGGDMLSNISRYTSIPATSKSTSSCPSAPAQKDRLLNFLLVNSFDSWFLS